jgi:hypothetical protein
MACLFFWNEGYLVKIVAGFRIHDMLLQRDHAAAPAQHEQLVKRLEQIVVSLARCRASLSKSEGLLDQIDQHFLGRHQHQRAQGRPADDDNSDRCSRAQGCRRP